MLTATASDHITDFETALRQIQTMFASAEGDLNKSTTI